MNWNKVVEQLMREAQEYGDKLPGPDVTYNERDKKNLQNAELLTSLAAALSKGTY